MTFYLQIGLSLLLTCRLAAESLPSAQLIFDETFTCVDKVGQPRRERNFYRFPSRVYGPPDWTQPIDYAHGRGRLELTVIDKPSDRSIAWQTCFAFPNAGTAHQCDMTWNTPERHFTAPGTYVWEWDMATMWGYGDNEGANDFTQGVNEIYFCIRDDLKRIPGFAPEGTTAGPMSDYYPMKVRVRIWILAGDPHPGT